MAAIITSKFRLDATDKFLASFASNVFYMGIGRPNDWAPSDSVPDTPYENDYTNNTLWENMFAMKRIDATDIIHSAPRNLWVSGTTYAEYDDQDTDIESKVYYVITDNNNVYMCLKAGTGTSTYNPDTIGVHTAGVINDAATYTGTDGYIWKYMFTVPALDVTKFLTSSFIPVRHLKSNPAVEADVALLNQWEVQDNAVKAGGTAGAIYNMKLTDDGDGYNTAAPTLTIVGDGDDATATCTVSGGAINSITMTAVGSGYTHATITVTPHASDTPTTVGVIRPVIGPPGGFGADPTNDLRAHYITINSVFTGDESGSIIDANEFRQLALIKNPIEEDNQSVQAGSFTTGNFYKILTTGSTATDFTLIGATDSNIGTIFKATGAGAGDSTAAQIAEDSAYDLCKKLTISHTTGVSFALDEIIEGHTSGDNGLNRAKGQVVEYTPNSGANPTAGVISYLQNETTGYGTFLETHFVRENGTLVAGRDITDVTAPLINHFSGDVMFIENRSKTTRATDQVETIRLVIAF